jgi:hypothetical protein
MKKEDYFYKHKVFTYLYSLKDGDLINILDICEEENRQNFVNYISDFIVEGFGTLEGFEIMFTPDYMAFYRRDVGSDKKIIYKGKTTIQ